MLDNLPMMKKNAAGTCNDMKNNNKKTKAQNKLQLSSSYFG